MDLCATPAGGILSGPRLPVLLAACSITSDTVANVPQATFFLFPIFCFNVYLPNAALAAASGHAAVPACATAGSFAMNPSGAATYYYGTTSDSHIAASPPGTSIFN